MLSVDADVAVIGSGIIGTTTALALQDAGLSVIAVDEQEPGAGTASGSAGHLHDGEIFPLAQPQLLPQLPKLLFDPLGPLVFRLAYLPSMVTWGTRFFAAMAPAKVERAIDALGSLNRLAIDSLYAVAETAGAREFLVRRGGLKIARDPRTLDGLAKELVHLERVGISARALDRSQLHALEPALAPDISGAIFFANSAHCTDPARFGERLAQRVKARGRVVRAQAHAVRSHPDDTWSVQLRGENSVKEIRSRQLVVTAGYGSAELLRPLGYRVPLATARGYHLMIPAPGVEVAHPMIFHEPHFGATPMNEGLRLAGTMEFASPQAPPDLRRARMLYDIAKRYIVNLRNGRATTWMGVRPSMPDTLPAIGRANRHSGLYYCFGHGHLGLTQAAISARCITDLIVNDRPPIDLAPFDLSRFE
jgi:glycine/D-amino acid oxidase-like deaminating enzyme